MPRRVHHLLMLALLAPASLLSQAVNWSAALRDATISAPDARIVVLDISRGRLLAARQLDEAARTLAAPGSTLKPLILYKLLASGHWSPDRRVPCDRSLTISGRRLACSHPPAPPFNARAALAWSCNTYFAALAGSLHAGDVGPLLRPTGLLGPTGLARDETLADFREPRTTDDAQLTVLGLENIRITPLELAIAYRSLALDLAAHSTSAAAAVVSAGLADSAQSGMAQPAGAGAVSVAGKTGTAENPGTHGTHGWFAGYAPALHPQVIIVVYLASGRGMDAAHIAGLVLAHAPLGPAKANTP